MLSIQKLTRLFSPSENISQEEAASLPQSLYSRTKSRITKTYKSISLIGNAFGNAVLVVVDSISALSIFGAIGCFFNSWSGNLVEPPKNQQARSQATQLLINQVNDLNKKVIKPSASTDDFENSQRKLNFGFELKEPTGLPSPVVSENGSCLISGNIGYSMGGNGPELFKTPHSSNSSDGSSNSKSRLAPAANH